MMRSGAWDLVIFDCDGVLIDSETLAVEVDEVVLAELGWPLTREDIIKRFVGRSHEDFVVQIEEHLGHALPFGWEERFQPLYRQACIERLRPMPGVVEMLDDLPLDACVASSSSHERLEFTLGLVDLYDRFAGRLFSAQDVTNGKPAPDLFLHAAHTLGGDPSQCVVIEDSPHGVQAARAAGMTCFAYDGGLVDRDALAGPGTIVFECMSDLVGLLTATSAAGDADL